MPIVPTGSAGPMSNGRGHQQNPRWQAASDQMRPNSRLKRAVEAATMRSRSLHPTTRPLASPPASSPLSNTLTWPCQTPDGWSNGWKFLWPCGRATTPFVCSGHWKCIRVGHPPLLRIPLLSMDYPLPILTRGLGCVHHAIGFYGEMAECLALQLIAIDW